MTKPATDLPVGSPKSEATWPEPCQTAAMFCPRRGGGLEQAMSSGPKATMPLPFDELVEAIKQRRSNYGHISGLRLDRAAPGEAWSSLPYRPVSVSYTHLTLPTKRIV